MRFSKAPGLRLLAVAVLTAAVCFSAVARAAEIRIGGTGNALGSMRLVAEAFAKSHPDSKITILTSIGSSGAVKAVPKGAIDIGLTSRTLTDDELHTGLKLIEYACSPTVFAVRETSKTTSISLRQVADIYSGKLSNWPDGAPIRPILRQPGDDNTRQIKSLSAEMDAAVSTAEQMPGMAFAVTDQEAADKLESIQGAIGVTTLALIRSEKRSLRALAIDGVEATPANASSGRYPLVKHFYLVLPKEPAAQTQSFVDFVQSDRGTKILKQTGHFIP
jgi:phosphate transport system substrate-binding protein